MTPNSLTAAGDTAELTLQTGDTVTDFSSVEQQPSYPRLIRAPQNIILAGIQGAGKGTQGESRLVPREGYSIFGASAEMKRHALWPEAKPFIASGQMVPDHIPVTVLRDYLKTRDAIADTLVNGSKEEALRTVYDGMPRTPGQVEPFFDTLNEAGREEPVAVLLHVSDHTARASIAQRGRRTGRPDDLNAAAVENRLQAFHQQTEPVLDRFARKGRLIVVNATPDFDYNDDNVPEETINAAFEEVYDRLIRALNTRR